MTRDECEHGSLRRSCLACETASELRRLTAELEEAKRERDSQHTLMVDAANRADRAESALSAMTAEVEALRASLAPPDARHQKALDRQRRYRKNHPARMGEARVRWRALNKTKNAAHQSVKCALEWGSLVRPDRCECGRIGPVDAHHDDYSKPLSIRWLCRGCHSAHHRTVQKETPPRSLLPAAPSTKEGEP
jgi:hypothetical protein